MNSEIPGATTATAPQRTEHAFAASFAKVPVTLQVILGSARVPLSELLNLQAGSLIELNQKLGEPVVIVVNGCKVASGLLFVMDEQGEKLGVKITEIHNMKDVG
jgi:flagellar motor switch protein FliN/FliY